MFVCGFLFKLKLENLSLRKNNFLFWPLTLSLKVVNDLCLKEFNC